MLTRTPSGSGMRLMSRIVATVAAAVEPQLTPQS